MVKRMFLALALIAVAAVSTQAQAAGFGVCNLNAVAFSNQTFNTRALAVTNCNTLLAQVNNQAAQCGIAKLANGKFRAQFRLNFAVVQQALGVILVNLQNFITQNNILANAQLAIQAAVTNGCG